MQKALAVLLFLLMPTLAAAQSIRPTGSWFDPRNGEWTLSLFGDCVVWKGHTWDFHIARSQDDGWLVALQSEGQQTELRLAQPDDTTLVVRADGRPAQLLRRLRDGLCPLPTTKDETPFATIMSDADSATIAGCYAGTAGTTVRLLCSWLNAHQGEWRTTTDSLGRFRFRLRTDVPLYALLIGGGQAVPVVILPGEALYCARTISSLRAQGYRLSDFAVLMRINALTRSFEQEFTKYGISYKVFGGFKFFERKEIKDILAYLRVAGNPFDSEAVARIINVPRRGIGEKTVQALFDYAAREDVSLYDAVLDCDALDVNSGAVHVVDDLCYDAIAKLTEGQEPDPATLKDPQTEEAQSRSHDG